MQESICELEKFGEFLTKNLRDNGIEYFDALINGLSRTPDVLLLEDDVKSFYFDQIKIIRKCVVKTIDNAIHDFLSAVQEKTCKEYKITITVNGKDITLISDCLQAEPYSDSGWYARYSKFGEVRD